MTNTVPIGDNKSMEVKKTFKPDTVINIGDLLDFHAISMHEHNPDLPSAGDELSLSKSYIKELESSNWK